MIVVQTPLRISFVGGGTDFEDFYANFGGAVLSTAIDKCVFVIVKERFDDMIYVNYSRKEIVDRFDKLEHELVREAMRITGVTKGIEITTLADVPAEGTGLGSSSSITVGLLQALFAYGGEIVTAKTLAEEACHIEIDILGKPIGRQDQYIASYGNMRFITFGKSGVAVEKIEPSSEDKKRLNDNLLLFYTGVTRKSSEILLEQKANINSRVEVLSEMRKLAFEAKDAILENEFDAFGEILHKGWELKKQMASKVSNSLIDDIYETACRAGAIGGKVTGAGGGGFILFYCPKDKQDDVTRALKGLRQLPFRFQQDGSKAIFNYRRSW
ncbi:D-glycero-alpha-D-manno-heptose 7-phosphate kinase [subsurface metagenome]|nr:GHMP kinase [Dehalococcoidia bacterium]